MTCEAFLKAYPDRLESLIRRGLEAVEGFDDQTLNRRLQPAEWSCAQIFEHMILAHEPYIQKVEAVLPRAPRGGPCEVRHSWMGRMIIAAAGPKGNAPVPRIFLPQGEGQIDSSIVARWAECSRAVIALAGRLEGVALNKVKVRSPASALVRMNLADVLEVVVQHTERHVGQIETRAMQLRG